MTQEYIFLNFPQTLEGTYRFLMELNFLAFIFIGLQIDAHFADFYRFSFVDRYFCRV